MIDITKNYNLTVNFSKGKLVSEEKVKIVENDHQSTKLIFNFEEEVNGKSLLLKIKHYLGQVYDFVLEVNDNKAEFIFPNTILVAGNLKISISLIGDNNEILTVVEYLDNVEIIETLGKGKEISESEVDALAMAISQVNALKTRILNGEFTGDSAYDVAVKNGYEGTEAEWIKTLIGASGKGISKIEKTKTQNLIDTYTITYTDESTISYNVKNGNGVTKIEEISREENDITYEMKFGDGSSFRYTITQGSDYDDSDIKEDIEDLDIRVSLLEGNSSNLTWSNISDIVRAGKAQNYFKVGDQLTTKWKDTANNTEYEVPLDVVAFKDVTIEENGEEKVVPGMVLQWHYATPFGVQFSQNQALKYAKSVIKAGTYYFTIGTTWGNNCVNGKSYQFTLTKDVPVGGQIQIGLANSEVGACPDQNPSNWRIRTYTDCNTVATLEVVTLTEGTSGTFLGNLNSNQKYNEDQINNLQSSSYGHNRWKTSALRQFLNSAAAKGTWWSNQGDVFDRIPNECATKNGFLSGVDEDLLKIIKPIKVATAINTTRDSDFGTWDYTFDKFFLPSMEEVYCQPQIAGEGTYWDYWKEKSGTSSPNAQYSTNANMITYAVENHSSAQHVRLRSATRGGSGNTWIVYASGSISNNGGTYAFRFAPACVIC